MLNYSKVINLSACYFAYSVIAEVPFDVRIEKLLDDNKFIQIEGYDYIVKFLIKSFDQNLFDKIGTLLNQLKEQLALEDAKSESNKDKLMEKLNFVIFHHRSLIDSSVLPSLFKSKAIHESMLITLIVEKLQIPENEDIISKYLNGIKGDSFNQMAVKYTNLPVDEWFSVDDFLPIFKFYRLLPRDFIDKYYKSEGFDKLLKKIMKVSGSRAIVNRIYLTFKATPEQMAYGAPEYIENYRRADYSDSKKLANILMFDSANAFMEYLRSLLYIRHHCSSSQSVDLDLTLHPNNVQLILDSREIIDFLKSNGFEFGPGKVMFKLESRFIERISIENIYENYAEKPIFSIPNDLENVPSENIDNWRKLEVLTGQSIDQLVTKGLIPKIEKDPEIYINTRNAFIYWMNSPQHDLMFGIKSDIVRQLLTSDPEIVIFSNYNDLSNETKTGF